MEHFRTFWKREGEFEFQSRIEIEFGLNLRVEVCASSRARHNWKCFLANKNSEINIFFNKTSYELIGWQTLDIYQNLSITYISKIKKNEKLKTKLFDLPQQN